MLHAKPPVTVRQLRTECPNELLLPHKRSTSPHDTHTEYHLCTQSNVLVLDHHHLKNANNKAHLSTCRSGMSTSLMRTPRAHLQLAEEEEDEVKTQQTRL
eukprot:1621090-Amphidinium_carterae.1